MLTSSLVVVVADDDAAPAVSDRMRQYADEHDARDVRDADEARALSSRVSATLERSCKVDVRLQCVVFQVGKRRTGRGSTGASQAGLEHAGSSTLRHSP